VEPDNLISAIIETANCKVNNKNIF